MAIPRHLQARDGEQADYWPGFVDALATLLLVIVFLLAVFIVGQFSLSQALTGRDEQLASLNARLAELAEQLNIAESERDELQIALGSLTAERDALAASLSAAEESLAAVTTERDEAEEMSREAQITMAMLNAQMLALRQELARLNAALEASEAREDELESQIVSLGERLNAALASEVARLQQYRSEFFGRLVEVLEGRAGVRVVGDRFVFESDVLFESGSADLNSTARDSLRPIARAIIEIAEDIPTDIEWVIRVDGHTDIQPLSPTAEFASNWELSVARSLSVVGVFEELGVPPRRLLAAGFGEHYPIAEGRDSASLARNRRIELKLDAR
jgi:chemotaxis protein MotB